MSNDVVLKEPVLDPSGFDGQVFSPVVWKPILSNSRGVECVHSLKAEVVEKRDGTYWEVTETKTISMKLEEKKRKWFNW